MPQTPWTAPKNVWISISVSIGAIKNPPPFVTLKHQTDGCVIMNLIGFQDQEMLKTMLIPYMITINPELLIVVVVVKHKLLKLQEDMTSL